MSKIIIQAGHEGRTSGTTGAPNEKSFNVDISDRVATELRLRGFEVKRVNADPKPEEIDGDWDLFLAIHYDADVYGKGGFFVDFPEPSTDGATEKSQKIAYLLRQEYGGTTGIVNHPERSNVNTRYYYMWKKISSKTPCVIIECGVGMHVPDDWQILHHGRVKVVEGITKGICLAFNVNYNIAPPPVESPVDDCKTKLDQCNTKVGELTVLSNNQQEQISSLNLQIVLRDNLISSIRQTINGKGWTWTKINVLKKLLN